MSDHEIQILVQKRNLEKVKEYIEMFGMEDRIVVLDRVYIKARLAFITCKATIFSPNPRELIRYIFLSQNFRKEKAADLHRNNPMKLRKYITFFLNDDVNIAYYEKKSFSAIERWLDNCTSLYFKFIDKETPLQNAMAILLNSVSVIGKFLNHLNFLIYCFFFFF